MVSTAITTDEEKKEYFDTEQELQAKTSELAQWIRESQKMVAFTGAGISTSAGIPDYRSGFDTVLETGPGYWEKTELREKYKADLVAADKPLPLGMRLPYIKTI